MSILPARYVLRPRHDEHVAAVVLGGRERHGRQHLERQHAGRVASASAVQRSAAPIVGSPFMSDARCGNGRRRRGHLADPAHSRRCVRCAVPRRILVAKFLLDAADGAARRFSRRLATRTRASARSTRNFKRRSRNSSRRPRAVRARRPRANVLTQAQALSNSLEQRVQRDHAAESADAAARRGDRHDGQRHSRSDRRAERADSRVDGGRRQPEHVLRSARLPDRSAFAVRLDADVDSKRRVDASYRERSGARERHGRVPSRARRLSARPRTGRRRSKSTLRRRRRLRRAQPGIPLGSGQLAALQDLYNNKLVELRHAARSVRVFARERSQSRYAIRLRSERPAGNRALPADRRVDCRSTAGNIKVGITDPIQLPVALANTSAGSLVVPMNSANNTVDTSQPIDGNASLANPPAADARDRRFRRTTGSLTVTVDGVAQTFSYNTNALAADRCAERDFDQSIYHSRSTRATRRYRVVRHELATHRVRSAILRTKISCCAATQQTRTRRRRTSRLTDIAGGRRGDHFSACSGAGANQRRHAEREQLRLARATTAARMRSSKCSRRRRRAGARNEERRWRQPRVRR